MKNNHDTSRNNLRKARTRTLIQLGGLVEKSGLFKALGIIPSSDMQKDETMKLLSLGLLGGFINMKKEFEYNQSVLQIWQFKAKQYLDILNT